MALCAFKPLGSGTGIATTTVFLKMMKRPGNFKGEGITLLELLAIVAVLAILSRAALPDFSAVLEQSRLAAGANGFVRALALARTEALSRGEAVRLRALGAGSTNPWGTSYAVETAAGVVLRQFSVTAVEVAEAAGADRVTILPEGRLQSGAVLRFCGPSGAGLELTLGRSGRVSRRAMSCA